MGRRRRWSELGLVVAVLLAGPAAAHADDFEHRVVGVVPFPEHERSGVDVAAADVYGSRFPQPGWVDRHYWDELVFDATEESDYKDRRTFGLTAAELAALDVYIKTTAPGDGAAPISEDMLDWWRQAIPEAVREFTGQPWRGRITTGVDSRELTDGRVNIGIGAEEHFAGRDACATATTSYYAFPDGGYARWAHAEIRFNPDDESCIFRDDARATTIAHEIGHVLGLFHVGDPAALMYWQSGYDRRYTTQLVEHAQLLYELGPGLPYPGFGPPIPGTTPEEWLGSVDEVVHDVSRGVVTGRAWHNGGGQDVVLERQRVVGFFVDAASEVIGGPVLDEHAERTGAGTKWEFELAEREGWDRLFLVAVVFLGHAAEDGFFVDCTDAEGKGQSGTITVNERRLRACVYRHDDIDVVEQGWTPGTAAQDLADRALEDLQADDDDTAARDATADASVGAIDTDVDVRGAEPVPALPLGGLGVLAGWLLLMGCRRRMHASTRRNRRAAG